MPVFMRAGCNTGSCHGAARGKDGFRLSLFGFDPDGDHYRLTREMNGRRINLAVPAESLLLEKATARCRTPAASGSRPASELYQTLIRWLEAGAPNDDVAKRRRRSSASSSIPKTAVLDGKGATQQMTVRAKYSDGTDRDVTEPGPLPDQQRHLGRRSTPDGLVTAGERGEAFVMARFETFTVGSQVIVLPKGLKFDVPERAREQLHRHARRRQAQEAADRPVGLCTDEVFLRRVYLDIVGLPADASRSTTRFMAVDRPRQAGEAGRRAARPQGVRRDLGA